MLATVALMVASLPLALALFSEASTTELKIPMMAITTKSSMSVNPLSLFINIILNLLLIYYNPILTTNWITGPKTTASSRGGVAIRINTSEVRYHALQWHFYGPAARG